VLEKSDKLDWENETEMNVRTLFILISPFHLTSRLMKLFVGYIAAPLSCQI